MQLIIRQCFTIPLADAVNHLKASCVGLGMLDEIPSVKKSEIFIKDYSKLVCYTDGLSELKGEDGKDIGTDIIIKHISNKKSC